MCIKTTWQMTMSQVAPARITWDLQHLLLGGCLHGQACASTLATIAGYLLCALRDESTRSGEVGYAVHMLLLCNL